MLRSNLSHWGGGGGHGPKWLASSQISPRALHGFHYRRWYLKDCILHFLLVCLSCSTQKSNIYRNKISILLPLVIEHNDAIISQHSDQKVIQESKGPISSATFRPLFIKHMFRWIRVDTQSLLFPDIYYNDFWHHLGKFYEAQTSTETVLEILTARWRFLKGLTGIWQFGRIQRIQESDIWLELWSKNHPPPKKEPHKARRSGMVMNSKHPCLLLMKPVRVISMAHWYKTTHTGHC